MTDTNLVVLPNVVGATISWLLSRSEITDITSRVATHWAGTAPALQVRLIGGLPVIDRPLVMASAALQIDAWGSSEPQASLLAFTAVGVLAVWPDEQPQLDRIAIAKVRFTKLPQSLTDTTYDKPKSRYSFDATVTYRALL